GIVSGDVCPRDSAQRRLFTGFIQGRLFKGLCPGQQPSCSDPAKTDALGLLQLIINCKAFENKSLKEKASKMRNTRNELFHSNTFKISDEQMKVRISQMVKLLECVTLDDDTKAEDAIETLMKIERFDLGISEAEVFEIEVKVWKGIIDTCKENKEYRARSVETIMRSSVSVAAVFLRNSGVVSVSLVTFWYRLAASAILAFVTSNEDLKERLGPKIDELRKDVEKLKDQVSDNTRDIEYLRIQWFVCNKYIDQVKLQATRSIESGPENNWNTETLQGEIYRKV
ncbi:hypothetical protein LSAT2_030686, partial [Lamellibrachia satsuma]